MKVKQITMPLNSTTLWRQGTDQIILNKRSELTEPRWGSFERPALSAAQGATNSFKGVDYEKRKGQ